MLELFAVFIGGGIGSALRFLVYETTKDFGQFFYGTLIINVLGSLFLGFVSYFAIKIENGFNLNLKLFLTTGISGGFTTFSTFSYEMFQLFQSHQIITGFVYLFISLFSGLFAVIIGMVIAKGISEFVLTPRFAYQEKNIEDEIDENYSSEEPKDNLYETTVRD